MIKLFYFAEIREKINKSEEILSQYFETPRDVLKYLNNEYHLELLEKNLLVAVNQSYVDFSVKLNDADEVAFIPPVAGG